jgi:hypothetical protein
MATPLDIAQIVKVISVAYPNWQVTEQTNEVYYQCLADIATDELKAAVLHCITEPGRKFAPSVGELRGAIGDIRVRVNNVPTTYAAWQEVLEQIRYTGSYGVPQFSSPLIERAVRQLGWRELCLSENQTADRARFVQCYDQLVERATKDDVMLPEVRGFIETNGGFMLPPSTSMKLLADRMKK